MLDMPTTTSPSKLRQLAEREQRVFATYPLVSRYFPAAAVEDARQRLSRAIERGDGPGLVVGAPGTGKSLLLQVLATQYHAKFDVVLLACARLCTRRAMLQAMLFELGLPYKIRDEGDLRLSLLDHLLSEQCPTGLILLVDEAQVLPVALLDELRILTNLVRGGLPRVRLILAGSSALEESFAHPELESFSQRLAARCYLAPLNREETRQYILAHIAASGGTPDDVMGADACVSVFDATDGVPRLVNQLCDRALQFAVADSRSCIDRQIVQLAWSDLQQLPTPWETPTVEEIVDHSDTIEFGKLGSSDRSFATSDDDVAAMIDEDTELDIELDIQPRAAAVETARVKPAIASTVDNPFAEKFDEEEVVLDNFAAWDDMFHRDAPRVANRRDPGFSTMVQAAIEASPVAVERFVVTSVTDVADAALPPSRPRLRLADVPEACAQEPVAPPAGKPSSVTNATDALQSVLAAFTTSQQEMPVVDCSLDEHPMLVIEEDAPQNASPPPVRREEYRNLFSRLRSG
jgi:type II secretory pathway predicted ATPase ExeA